MPAQRRYFGIIKAYLKKNANSSDKDQLSYNKTHFENINPEFFQFISDIKKIMRKIC